MRILLISSSYLPRVGGLEIFVSDLGRFFLKKGHTVKIITQKYPIKLKSKEYIDGIEISRYLFFDPKPPIRTLRSVGGYIYTLALFPINLIRFIFLIKKFRPDVINYHFIGSATLSLLIYLNLFKNRLIVSLHGEDVRTLPFSSRISMYLFKKILKKADFITANSHNILDRTLKIAPFIKNKAKVIYNGIPLEGFEKIEPHCQKGKYIFSAGRLVRTKGFDILIEAFGAMSKEANGIDLIIVGGGPEKDNLEVLIKKFDLEDRIKLFGSLDRREVINLLKGCEFFVLSSREEPFGIVMLEAMACGKPTIATRSGGPEEIIKNGINGLLVDKENPQKLAEGMLKIFRDTALRAKISDNSKETVLKFDIAKTAKEYLDIFKR